MALNKTWNQHVVKKENKSLVLNVIQSSSPISRADIASITGLNKGTVSSQVTELIDEHLIYESGPGKSSGGRRPVMLLFNKIAGYSIGIDLGVNYILGLLTDLEGNICKENYIKIKDLSFDEIMEKLYEVIDSLIASAPSSPYGIIGIGIGVPGTVDNNGNILLAPNLKWKNIHLKEILEEKYHIPIVIENEANGGAHGERKFGIGMDTKHIVYVSIGIGIGVGLNLNGELYKGNNGFSGELGHMTIDINGKDCRCGSKGCWELYASEQALDDYAAQLKLTSLSEEEISLESLLSLAEKGDEKGIALFEEIGNQVGIGLKNIVNIFNPEQIIVGGRLAAAKKWLIAPIKKQLDQTQLFQQQDLQVDFSSLSTHSAAMGVAAFAVEEFLQNNLHKA
ncbi:ROK family transcriptional regulator [Ornithinibacillus gellani]|uniref:ROK family transcriptional regulator n=1 Tax=Ornithinibacillus gellani TaxID=2293253 RepID=UPI000F4A48B0|nr:ROK family transcriptional regulator [Ornithinibacillus gellani]TQS75130.1 ROK family transcriptional regulator [Ornithinibacillus gellani]